MTAYSKGTQVDWKWGNGTGTGKIETVHICDVTRTIEGTEVTRKASEDDPAYYILLENGDAVLKSHSEVTKS